MVAANETKSAGPGKDKPLGAPFVPTEMGSARFVTLEGGSTYKYEEGPTKMEEGFRGPPWSVEPSMHFVCDEVGIDYNKFIEGIKNNKGDTEIAREFGVSPRTIEHLKERFYKVDVLIGNYGQD